MPAASVAAASATRAPAVAASTATLHPSPLHSALSAVLVAGSAGSNRSSPLLPVCAVPTEKSFDNVIYNTK